MSEDIKTIASDLGSAFEEFKKSYDEKLDKMAKGENTSELDAKLAAIESKMDNYEDINQRIVQSQKKPRSSYGANGQGRSCNAQTELWTFNKASRCRN